MCTVLSGYTYIHAYHVWGIRRYEKRLGASHFVIRKAYTTENSGDCFSTTPRLFASPFINKEFTYNLGYFSTVLSHLRSTNVKYRRPLLLPSREWKMYTTIPDHAHETSQWQSVILTDFSLFENIALLLATIVATHIYDAKCIRNFAINKKYRSSETQPPILY